MNGKVSNLAIAKNQLEINMDTEAGVFANQMTSAAVEKVLIYNSKINNTAGKAAGFVGTINNSTLKNIFVHGEVHAKSMASGFVLNANGSTRIFLNCRYSTVPESIWKKALFIPLTV